MWVWAGLLGSAALHAAPPALPEQLQVQRAAGAGMAAACAPLDQTLALLRGLRFPSDTRSPAYLAWDAVRSTDDLAALGLQPDGTLLAWGNSTGLHYRLPFQPDPALKRAFLARLFPDQPISEAPTQQLRLPSGLSVQIALVPEGIQLSLPTPYPGDPPAPTLLEGLPAQPGCLLYGHLPERSALSVPGSELLPTPDGEALWLPFGDGPAELRLVLPGEAAAPSTWGATASGQPIGGASQERPIGFVFLNLEPLQLAAQEGTPWSPEPGSSVDLEKLRRRFWIPGGTTLALFNLDRSSPRFAVVVPVTGRRERPASPRQLRRALRRALQDTGSPFVWTDRTTFLLDTPRGPLYGGLEVGRITMTSAEDLLEDVRQGQGTPWLSPELAARAAEWPLYIDVAVPIRPDTHLALGARIQQDLLIVGFDTPAQPLGDALEEFLTGLGPFVSLGVRKSIHEQRVAEVPATLTRLCEAQQAYHQTHGAYLALPPTPRAAADLDSLYQPWPDPAALPEAWGRLGWTPPLNLRGSYSAELTGTGSAARVSLYGRIDADGDGKPAAYVLHCPSGPEPLRLSAPENY